MTTSRICTPIIITEANRNPHTNRPFSWTGTVTCHGCGLDTGITTRTRRAALDLLGAVECLPR